MIRLVPYLVLLLVSLATAGCEVLVEAASGDRIESGSYCINLKMQCRAESYSEWLDENRQTHCACRNHLTTGTPSL
jgi:hypothetical protein